MGLPDCLSHTQHHTRSHHLAGLMKASPMFSQQSERDPSVYLAAPEEVTALYQHEPAWHILGQL